MSREREPPEPRFWAKVQKSRGCWTWTAGKLKAGYGKFLLWRGERKLTVLAHRYSWELHNGQVPEGLDVLHKCDNPSCVRPTHLFVGTQKDNAADMFRKGRQQAVCTLPLVKGEQCKQAILTNADVLKIRALVASGVKQAEVARMFSTDRMHIHGIVTRRIWKHI